MTCNLLFRSLG